MRQELIILFIYGRSMIYIFYCDGNSIGGVKVRVSVLSVVDCGFDTQSSRTKDYKTGICSFFHLARSINMKEQRQIGSELG